MTCQRDCMSEHAQAAFLVYSDVCSWFVCYDCMLEALKLAHTNEGNGPGWLTVQPIESLEAI